MKSIHQSKKVKTNWGFGRWEDQGKNNKETMKKCSFCDYVSKHASNLKKHMKRIHFKEKSPKIKHIKEPSQRTKYRHISKLRSDLNSRIKSKENPATVFGEEEVKKLLEDCNSSTRELSKLIFGSCNLQ